MQEIVAAIRPKIQWQFPSIGVGFAAENQIIPIASYCKRISSNEMQICSYSKVNGIYFVIMNGKGEQTNERTKKNLHRKLNFSRDVMHFK